MSMFAKYQGLSSLLPSGYQEALMQPGRNIAAGISSASQSIASGIEKYGAMRERTALTRGKVEAIAGAKMRSQGADSWFNQQGEEAQRLLVKFQDGKESPDELLRLSSYLEHSEAISQRDEAAKMQKLVYDTQMLNLQKAQGMAQDDEALRKATVVGLAAPDTTSYQETRQDIPVEHANALASYGAAHFSDLPGGGAVPGLDNGALNKYNDEVEAYRQEQAQPPMTVPNLAYTDENVIYQTGLKAADADLAKYSSELAAAKGMNASNDPATVTPFNYLTSQSYGQLGSQRRAESPLEAAERAAAATSARRSAEAGVAKSKAKLAELKLTEPQKLISQERVMAKPVAPELSAITGSTTTSTPATSVEQFGASLKHLTEMGRATPKSIEALRDTFGIVDAKVQSVGGITLVTQGGNIVQAFQNKNANDDLKALTAEENKKLEAIQSSEGDIDRIEEALKTGNSGVIVGLLQKFWPWAVDSKKVEAMRNSAVPNLARGVFGEVGVLTETDVKRYIAMIPGLNNSPTQQATLIKELRTKLAATKLNSIQSLAAGGRDVSGWVSGMASPAASSGGGKRITYNASTNNLDR